MVNIEVKGMAAVGAALKQLPENMREKVCVGGILEAAQVVLAGVQTEVPIGTGNLFRHVRMGRRKRGMPWNLIQYVVYVQSGGGKKSSATGKKAKGVTRADLNEVLPYYWYFLEFGTSKMSANPFMERGFAKSASNAAGRARDYMRQQVLRGALTEGLRKGF